MGKLFMNVFADSERYDPLKNFNFVLNFAWKNGDTYMSSNFGFNKVSGLKADIDVIEYREGGDNLSTRKMAGLVKWDAITLEKGMTDNTEMWDAFTKLFATSEASGSDADGYRGTLSISIQNRKKDEVRKFVVSRAWISSYEAGDLDAQGNSVIIEKIVIQHEGFTKA